jgi:hypothetical protein
MFSQLEGFWLNPIKEVGMVDTLAQLDQDVH